MSYPIVQQGLSGYSCWLLATESHPSSRSELVVRNCHLLYRNHGYLLLKCLEC